MPPCNNIQMKLGSGVELNKLKNERQPFSQGYEVSAFLSRSCDSLELSVETDDYQHFFLLLSLSLAFVISRPLAMKVVCVLAHLVCDERLAC